MKRHSLTRGIVAYSFGGNNRLLLKPGLFLFGVAFPLHESLFEAAERKKAYPELPGKNVPLMVGQPQVGGSFRSTPCEAVRRLSARSSSEIFDWFVIVSMRHDVKEGTELPKSPSYFVVGTLSSLVLSSGPGCKVGIVLMHAITGSEVENETAL